MSGPFRGWFSQEYLMDAKHLQQKNRRTAMMLGVLVLIFFAGVVIKQFLR